MQPVNVTYPTDPSPLFNQPSSIPGVATQVFSTQAAAIAAAPAQPGFQTIATNVGSPTAPSYTYQYANLSDADRLAQINLQYPGMNFTSLPAAIKFESAH